MKKPVKPATPKNLPVRGKKANGVKGGLTATTKLVSPPEPVRIFTTVDPPAPIKGY